MTYSELFAMTEALEGVSVLDLQDCLYIEVLEDDADLEELFDVLRGASSAYLEEEYQTWHYTFDGFVVDVCFAAWEL